MLRIVASACLLAVSPALLALDVSRENVQLFIDEMVDEHQFDRDELTSVLEEAELKQSIIDAISSPAEKKLSWGEYRDIFLTEERIAAGAAFWKEHGDMLAEIAGQTGVPETILVGIIGVETYYGRITGNFRVLDALATLAFHYPPRSRFFRQELGEFLLLSREEDMPATAATGSYAGAMGRPQFMPSSFRAYAVDSTGDGKRDIWEDWADVAGSIANYFNEHGWRTDEETVARATLGSAWTGAKPEPANTLKPSGTVSSLSEDGVVFATDQDDSDAAELLALDGEDGREYWVAFHNFFVITRYNRSVMYALAVHQLGEAVARAAEPDRDAG